MVTHCVKCGQTVLQTDSVCWHCGAQQSGKKEETVVPKNGREGEATALGNTAVVEEEPLSLTAVSVYALFTLVCFIVLLLILGNLAKQPLFLINPLLDREPDWQPITDTDLQFTLDLPPTWYAIENEGNVPTVDFQQVMKQLEADTAFMALETKFAGDIIPYMLLQTDELPIYLLIVGSKGLQTASNEQLMDLVDRSGWEVLRMNEVELEARNSRLTVTHYLGSGERETRCTTQFVPAENKRFILIACAPTEQFPQVAEKISKMIALFQPLIYQNRVCLDC